MSQKIVQIGQTRYYIESEDDEISLTHELARKGYSVKQIASILGVSEKKVRKYISECW
ncbi:helix-turn-helix domain [Sulfolobales Beppu rod-shaped virus 1]|uniref:Helix-turn-helix domain n=1 Tax=Sulfolobales Beppu rod-shaped virus 1 TaxID=2493121 RepID=A0A3Q8Q3Z9_9VIRU|nr:helix-turn-helix domain [Sulfolobales Beppu rod-shaped virus 1]AZI75944.1 helix-turn-helix domain [Sulfolobales Beppu rod-shaped virus 1]